MKKYRLYVLDDDREFIAYLKTFIARTPHVLAGSNVHPLKALEEIPRVNVDILFLDMQMQPLSGLDVAAQLPHQLPIIFCTSYRDLAIDAYETYTSHFLLKPVNFKRFCEVINQTMHSMSAHKPSLPEDKFVQLNKGGKGSKILLWFEDIAYGCMVGPNSLQINFKDGSVQVLNVRIGAFMKELPSDEFVRISKEMLISLRVLQKVLNGEVYVKIQDQELALPLGPGYANAFYQWLEKHKRSWKN